MASQDETDIFNPQKHTKVGDIFVIGGDVNLYELTSTLELKNLTGRPENKIKGKMFNLTHFMKNFKEYIEEYMKLVETKDNDPWGFATLNSYKEYIIKFKKSIDENFPPGAYTFFDFLYFCENIKVSDASNMIDLNHLMPFYELLKQSEVCKIIVDNKTAIPQFKKRKSPKKSAKKTPKKSSKKTPKKSSKKSSKKTPKKSSKKTPKKKSKSSKNN
jgi:hypothetical protein